MPYCCAVNCYNSFGKGFTLRRFPTDPVRRRIWAVNVRRKDWTPIMSSRLCDVHFTEDSFEQNRADGRKLLKKSAVPTLFNHTSHKKAIKQRRKATIDEILPPKRRERKKSTSDNVGNLPPGIKENHKFLKLESEQTKELQDSTASFLKQEVFEDQSHPSSNPQHNDEVDGTDESDDEFYFIGEALSDLRYEKSREAFSPTSSLEIEEVGLLETDNVVVNSKNHVSRYDKTCGTFSPMFSLELEEADLSETDTVEVNSRNHPQQGSSQVRRKKCASTQTTVPLKTILTEDKLKKKVVEQRKKINILQNSMKKMREKMQSMRKTIAILKHEDQHRTDHDHQNFGINNGL